MLNNLFLFEKFDLDLFLEDKVLGFLNEKPWVNNNNVTLGLVAELVIIKDTFDYGFDKNGNPRSSNDFEKLKVKVPHKTTLNLKRNSRVSIENVQKVVAYGNGNFKNSLSIIADVVPLD